MSGLSGKQDAGMFILAFNLNVELDDLKILTIRDGYLDVVNSKNKMTFSTSVSTRTLEVPTIYHSPLTTQALDDSVTVVDSSWMPNANLPTYYCTATNTSRSLPTGPSGPSRGLACCMSWRRSLVPIGRSAYPHRTVDWRFDRRQLPPSLGCPALSCPVHPCYPSSPCCPPSRYAQKILRAMPHGGD